MLCTRTTVLATVLTVLVVASFVCVQPADGTMFILGGACVAALRTVEGVFGAQLERLGVEQDVDVVLDFCRNILFNGSIEVQVYDSIRSLIDLVSTGNIPEADLPQFARIIRRLANQIRNG